MKKLYYTPGTCSLAVHIALREMGIGDFAMERVDLKKKTTESNEDFWKINSKGYVPVFIDDNVKLTECVSILYYLAEKSGHANLALLENLAFIASEIHKGFMSVAFAANDEAAAAARDKLSHRLVQFTSFLKGDYLGGAEFSVADAYFYTTLRWIKNKDIETPEVFAVLRERIAVRPAVRKALEIEGLD
ncbi:MAG: glutathione S-transferase N-terminal domain-containing protein [Candidatus Eutrophobiaceae bacterium]